MVVSLAHVRVHAVELRGAAHPRLEVRTHTGVEISIDCVEEGDAVHFAGIAIELAFGCHPNDLAAFVGECGLDAASLC